MPAEKRPSPGLEETAGKRPKLSVKEQLAGCIEKVSMKNFMCHSALDVDLNTKINFVVGRNGSGKSAILSAVVLGLGCKASSTNRASNIRDFVKNGTNMATVQITLSNEGLRAYKPEIYGPKIIVVRNIFTGTTPSTYKIKSAKGEIISTKREDLEKIKSHLNIQVDNPVSVLNQDTARTFLINSDEQKKYMLFMKATRLEDVNYLHGKSLEYREVVRKRLKLRMERLKKEKEEIKELEKKAAALRKLEEMKKKANTYQDELLWAFARDEEKLLTELQVRIDKENDKVQPYENALQQCREELQIKQIEMGETKSKLKEINDDVTRITKRQTDAISVKKAAQLKYRTARHQYEQVEREHMKYKQDGEAVGQEIYRFNKEGKAKMEEKQQLTEAVNMHQEEISRINSIQRTVELEYQNLRGESDHFNEQEAVLRADKRNIEHSIKTKMNNLQQLKTLTNNLAIYGDWMPTLIHHIEEYNMQGRFARKPLGPLGAYLKLKDAQWARAIELEISGILRSFAVHNGRDAQVLQQLFRQVISGGRYPGILVSKFTDQLHNIRETHVKAPGYKNIFDALDIADVNVANFLIDNCYIEAILLIPTGKEASAMMSQNVPRNCRKCITLQADQYFPYPDYRMYAGNKRAHVSLLQVSKQDIIRQLESELKEEQQYLQAVTTQLSDWNKRIHENKERRKDVEERIMAMRRKKSEISAQITEYESAIELLPDAQHYLMLESELETIDAKIVELMQKAEEAQEASNGVTQRVHQATEDVRRIETELQEKNEERQNLQAELSHRHESLRMIETKIKDSEELCTHYKSHANAMLEAYNKQKIKTEEIVKQASNLCPLRIKTKRSANDIQEDIQDCQSYERSMEGANNASPEVLMLLEEKKRKHRTNSDLLSSLSSGLKFLGEALERRKDIYKRVKKVTVTRVMWMFVNYMKVRHYKGHIEFDHDAKVLELHVSPNSEQASRETKSLSGGERSYSTVCFIMSLWDCIDPPFFIMDEFDVFMDKVNRRIVLESLLQHAKTQKKQQFVFLTPQDTTVAGSKNVTIHMLNDPQRTDSAL